MKPDPQTPAIPDAQRRALLAAPMALGALPALAAPTAGPRKRLQLAFRGAETTFDPARITDLYSRAITAHIFESLYGFDHLARPWRINPVLADGMPEASEDMRVWTVRLKKGVFFADDPVFAGRPREVVAEDILYAFKRIVDPASLSPGSSGVLEQGIVGLAEARQAALDSRKPFDYDAPIAGLQAPDRYTVRFTLAQTRPRFAVSMLAAPDILPAQAREVVEHYRDQVGDHPVGTGPFRLARWVRASKIVLERNPGYRERFYEAHPAADDAAGQAIAAQMKGRRIPIVDEVEVSIIEENQPRWLSFANAEIDALATTACPVPEEFLPLAAPNGHLAPFLARQKVQYYRSMQPDMALWYFNMEDPVVGGYTPEKVALRRAVSLAYDIASEIRLIRRGQAIPAQSPWVPETTGYDPAFKSEMSEYDPARANALLDLYGYVDSNGDGWRELPDGRPLLLTFSTEPDQIYRLFNDLMQRCLKVVRIRCKFDIQQWPAHMKQALAGSLQIWSVGESAADPDGGLTLQLYYGPQAGQENLARFKLPAMDAIYERLLTMPDGPEREKLMFEAKRLAVAYMPYRVEAHRIANDLLHPWVHGYRRPIFWNEWWHMVDVDPDRKQSA